MHWIHHNQFFSETLHKIFKIKNKNLKFFLYFFNKKFYVMFQNALKAQINDDNLSAVLTPFRFPTGSSFVTTKNIVLIFI